jgi:hypothetical protein
MLAKRLIKSNDAGGGGACTNTVDLYNPFPDGGGVALYQLNGDATDVSGNYDGTATNVTYGAGQFGQAGVFNGSSSIIDLPNNSFNFTTVSVSFWLKLNSITGEDYVLDVYDEASAARGYAISTDASNKIKFRAWNNNFAEVLSSSTLSLNTWYYIAMVATQTSASIYINGSLDNSGSLNGFSFQAQQSTSIGAYRGTVGGGPIAFLDGSLDQVRIFNRVLRPYEIEALYTEEYCTPTIVPSEHFNTVLYTGTGASQSITNVGFQPDFTWIKNRSRVDVSHSLQDSVRGTGASKTLYTDGTYYEGQYGNFGYISSFDIDGFTVNPSSSALHTSQSGDTYVAWNFKAGGSAVTNTDGTITSQVSANTEAGFSIVTWTGLGANGQTVGHGLGTPPQLIITKCRNLSGEHWYTYSEEIGNTKFLALNLTSAARTATEAGYGAGSNFWNDTSPTSSVFSLGNIAEIKSNNHVAYCFAEVEGFSNFGSYVGTTTTSGTTVITGFEPAFVMIKRTDATGFWTILDNKRDTTNPNDKPLYANAANAESTGQATNFYENGFQPVTLDSDVNSSGSYIYMAFAADPTTIEPSLEDSFNTVLWTGDSVQGRSISGVGFAPDFTWIKKRTGNSYNSLFDTVRGAGNKLVSNETLAEYGNTYGGVSVFESDGFAVNSLGVTDLGDVNLSPNTYVAWNWKAAELPAINSDGSIPSVVSANPAAGFSIVSYTGNGANATIGHGLGVAPSVYIVKNRDAAIDWAFETTLIDGSLDYLFLNSAAAKGNAGEAVPNETIFNIDGSIYLGANNNKFIAYCFAEVAGFSKFGSYTGTGSAGNTVTLGFEPAFVMVKRTDGTQSWGIYDNKRTGGGAGETPQLLADSSGVEYYEPLILTATGFRLDGAETIFNGSGMSYIYMAFANQF